MRTTSVMYGDGGLRHRHVDLRFLWRLGSEVTRALDNPDNLAPDGPAVGPLDGQPPADRALA